MRVGRFEIEPLLVLLVFVPVSIVLELLHTDPSWFFIASALAIIPLAGLMGKATEHLAEHVGAGRSRPDREACRRVARSRR